MKSPVRPALPTASVGSSQATDAAVDNSAPLATHPVSTYKSGNVVQTTGATSAAVLLVLYFWGNSQPEAAGLIPPPWDKLAHLLWYATLAGLLLLGLGRRAWPWVLAGTLLLAGWDEWHQFALPGRSPDIDDWLADALGVLAGVGIVWRWGGRANFSS